MMYKNLMRPLLFRLDAEQAHDVAYRFGRMASGSILLKTLARMSLSYRSSRLSQEIWGLRFENPVGLAAGFDKNGHLPEILQAAGFGHIEVGSITAHSSTGNPKPRCFRLPADEAIINRMGLNNDGAKTIVKRLENKEVSIPLGLNIAKTHNPAIMDEEAILDYAFSFREAQRVADYITINISCPNTKEGKTFEDPEALNTLLETLELREDASITPWLIKLSSDVSKETLMELVDVAERHRAHGYVVANTSSERHELDTDEATLLEIGTGGLSGPPITSKSTERIRWVRQATNAQKPIIGVGGINSFKTALAMIKAGADLLQVYTGLVYEGPGLVKRINKGLVAYLEENGLDSIHQIKKES